MMLDGIRVLALTDERGLLAGRLLADLGADVVLVEPPEGSRGRAAAPSVDGAGSLVWQTYAAGQRSIVVELGDDAAREDLRALAERADVVVTSWSRADLERWGLDPAELRRRSERLVVATVTGFGWDGPKSEYADADLVVWAAGGPLGPHRDGDRPPVRPSVPQAFLHAGADAVVGVLLALAERDHSGLGQHVDVSAQVSLGQATLARILADAVGDDNPAFQQTPTARADRSGSGAATPNAHKKWAVRDGLVELHLSMGPAAGAFTNRLFAWVAEAGELPADIAEWDWRTVPDRIAEGDLDPAELDRARAAVRAFLSTQTKADVLQAALERRLLSIPIFDVADVLTSPQLVARGFFADVELADGSTLSIPGSFAAVTGGESPRVRGRAPLLGEHDVEVRREWMAEQTPVAALPHDVQRQLPLEGVRVIDLSWVVAGPLIGRTLADFGADVIRVESSTRLDTARMMQPFHGGTPDREGSALYGTCNAGKRGMTLDLTDPAGQQIVRELVATADVVLASFAPGQLARWGLSPEELRRDRPDLIVLSTSIAGESGPWAGLAGFGNVGSSLSGVQLLVGWPDALPFGPFGPYTDYIGPRMSLVTLLAALRRRRENGLGCLIDVAQMESGAFFLGPQLAQYSLDGTVAARRGNADEQHAPHGVYPALAGGGHDRFVAIAVTDDDQWSALADEIGRPDLRDRADLADARGRRAAADELDAAVKAWTAQRDADEIEQMLQRVGVPAHIAVLQDDYVRDAQLAYRGHLVELPHDLHGTTTVEGARVRLVDTPGGPRAAAPTLGEHTREILAELGHPTDRVDEWERTGVLR